MADDLEALEPWLGDVLESLAPGPRRRLSLKIGQAIRRTNAARIARNEEPDGRAMTPRKPRRDRKRSKLGRIKRAAGKKSKMFREMRLARTFKVRATAEGVELGFRNPVMERIATEHHYGEEAFVGKTRDGRTIKARMAQRRLLGFSRDDQDAIIDAVAQHLSPDG